MLLTSEVEKLARWLDQAAAFPEKANEVVFLEPNLAFERRPGKNRTVEMRVWFELEARPRWAQKGFVDEPDFSVDLDLDREQLASAAQNLRTQLDRFPVR